MNIQQDWRAGCEAEPLAFSGAIQPHGGLLCLNAQLLVTHASAQIDAFLPYPAASLLSKPLPAELLAIIAPLLNKLPAEAGSHLEHGNVFTIGDKRLDINLTRNREGLLIELTPYLERIAAAAPANSGRKITAGAHEDELHAEMAITIHELIHFDRVMIYAFREDGDGEVLAEARRVQVYGSYLGLRFPGSDIPAIARALYLQNPWRLIPDSQAAPVALLSNAGAAPDLTWSDLRSVSPVHQAYLANMNVGASLSFPIVVNKALWGLVACHHATPLKLPREVLLAASQLVRKYGYTLLTRQAEARMRYGDSITSLGEAIRMALIRHGEPLGAIAEIGTVLLEQFQACGLAMRFGDDWTSVGAVPANDALDQLDEWFECDCSEVIYQCDSLARHHSGLGHLSVSGAMALKMKSRLGEEIHLWLFRNELLQEIAWGGNPNKPVEYSDGTLEIAPRRSFEQYVEKRLGYCTPWTSENNLLILRLRHILFEVYG